MNRMKNERHCSSSSSRIWNHIILKEDPLGGLSPGKGCNSLLSAVLEDAMAAAAAARLGEIWLLAAAAVDTPLLLENPFCKLLPL